MNTKLEYKNNILYIIIYGILIGSKTKEFESTIIPIIYGLRTSKVMINMNYIDLIDKKGIDSIIKISSIVNKFDGKTVLYDLNDYLKNNLKESDIFDYCFKAKNEYLAKELLNI